MSQSIRVDAPLQVGKETQEVTVTEAPPAIETDRAVVQTQLSGAQISSLPIPNRNFTNLALLTPGSVVNTFQHAPSENPQQSTLVNTGGQEFAGTNYQLDGMNNNDTVLGITMVNPAVDSVGAFTAQSNNYDAEYQATGNVIQVETKSGNKRLPRVAASNFYRTICFRLETRSRRVCMRPARLPPSPRHPCTPLESVRRFRRRPD